ncbi:hypothetical protein HZ326_15844 [Fusarium oxysporum f. sp. albedinis]|nr:hypothetical protein HZ326_15844 [Fusarium oxysporum f. sp. albedinis]
MANVVPAYELVMIINKNSGDGIREEVNEVFKGLLMSAIMAASAVAPCIMTQKFQRKADLALCFITNATFLA